METIRLGLIGCGGMMSTHVIGVKYVEHVEIVAVCDIIEEKAQKVADALGGTAKVFTKYVDMVDMVDAVMIALPHDLHFECGMFFAMNNKHVLMEKPLCNTERECEILIETCEARHLKLMCAYPVRFWPGIRKLKELIDSGEYGEIIQMSVWTEQLTGANLRYDDPTGHQVWSLTGRLGGGQLFSHGCHYVDLMLWFLGNPITGVHMGTRNGTPWMLREGTSALVMKFENGAVGYHGATWGARGTRLGYDFQIQTEKGMLEYDHSLGEVREYNGNGIHKPGHGESKSYNILWTREGKASKETQYEISHFVDCVLHDKTPLTNGRAALQGLRVIWKLYNAEENNMIADLRGLGLEQADQ